MGAGARQRDAEIDSALMEPGDDPDIRAALDAPDKPQGNAAIFSPPEGIEPQGMGPLERLGALMEQRSGKAVRAFGGTSPDLPGDMASRFAGGYTAGLDRELPWGVGDRIRADRELSQRSGPAGDFAEAAGTLASPGARLAKGAGLIAGGVNAAATGGLQGAAQAYSDSDPEASMLERLGAALQGGWKGAAAAGVLHGAMSRVGGQVGNAGESVADTAQSVGQSADRARLRAVLPKQTVADLELKSPEAMSRLAADLEAPRDVLEGAPISGGYFGTSGKAAARASTVGADAGRRIRQTEDILSNAYPEGGGPDVDVASMVDDLTSGANRMSRSSQPLARETTAPYMRNIKAGVEGLSPPYATERGYGRDMQAAEPGFNGPPSPERLMPFGDAIAERRTYDQSVGSGFNRPSGSLTPQDVVDRGVANDYRAALGNAIERDAPELSPRWQGANRDAHVANMVIDPATRAAVGQVGASPMGVRDAARLAAGGPVAAVAARAADPYIGSAWAQAQRDTSSGLADFGNALRFAGQDTDRLANMTPTATVAGREGAQLGEAQPVPRETASTAPSRPELAQAIYKSMESNQLGPYGAQFAQAFRDGQDLVPLFDELARTNPEFRQRYVLAVMGAR